MFDLPDISEIVASALAEDLGVDASALASQEVVRGGGAGDSAGNATSVWADLLARDVTTASVLDDEAASAIFTGVIAAREECVVCGVPVAAAVFEALGALAPDLPPVLITPLIAEGSLVTLGTPVAEVEGPASIVLSAERTALNFVMVLSGIATETHRWVEAAAGHFDVCDTRKTFPGLRALSKYAVRAGGGVNHRKGLFDQVLVKDNHLCHVGGIAEAIARARAGAPGIPIEIEADTAEQAAEAARTGADIVLLDNMAGTRLAEAVAVARAAAAAAGREVVLEVSGNLGIERLPEFHDAGIDRVSASALTLALPVDFGLDDTQGGPC